MLDMKFVRENSKLIKADLRKRGETDRVKWVDDVIKFDQEYRAFLQKSQKLRHKRNLVSSEINKLKKQGKSIKSRLKEIREIPTKIKKAEETQVLTKGKIDFIMHRLPLISHASVPIGKDDTENKVVRVVGKKPKFGFKPKDHIDLGESLDLIDVKRASKVAGARFGYLKNELVLMELALVQYVMNILVKEGFNPVIPPALVREKALFGTGFLPEGRDAIYKVEDEDLMLVGTAEVPLGAMHMDEVLRKDELPKWYAGFSPCFRTEAGSHGKDTKGIFRVHQFNKVEMFKFCLPKNSWKEHEHLIKTAEKIFKGLKIPYRIVNVCTGELGYVAKKYDLETWMPGQGKYREVVSCSNCLDYQSRRLNIKYSDGKTKNYVHTLNSTACAIGRTLVAIVENYQKKDGSITVPSVLVKYMNNLKKIKRP